MKKLTELLQASEIALPLGRTNAWPAAGIHPMSSASGLMLNDESLMEAGTPVVLASLSDKLGLGNQYFTCPGFKFNGAVVKWPLPGTQPYSTTIADNCLKYIVGASDSTTVTTVQLWRDLAGVLKCEVGGVTYELGATTASDYATTKRRGLRFIILHLCAAGGGGGRHGGALNGWAGGSGSALATLIDMLPFTNTDRLTISIPGGGEPGHGNEINDSADGQNGGPLALSSSAPSAAGTISIMGGEGGKRSRTAINGYGMGGGPPDVSQGGTLSNVISFLASTEGAKGGVDRTRYKPGMLPSCSYTDPNPTATTIYTTPQSFDSSLVGSGGKGGEGENDEWGWRGKPGALYIYY